MTLKINVSIKKDKELKKYIEYKEYDSEFDGLVTYTTYLDEIFVDYDAILFSIEFNEKKLPLGVFDFSYFIEGIIESIEEIKSSKDFYIYFADQGTEFILRFISFEGMYKIEVDGHGNRFKKFDEDNYILKEEVKNILTNVIFEFVDAMKFYCIQAYNEEYFKEFFGNFLKNKKQ